MNCYIGKDKLPNGEIIKNVYPPVLTNEIYDIYYIGTWSKETKEWKNPLKQFKAKKSLKEFDWNSI